MLQCCSKTYALYRVHRVQIVSLAQAPKAIDSLIKRRTKKKAQYLKRTLKANKYRNERNEKETH